jgi:hypothetical protein
MIDEKVIAGLKERYPNIHPMIFHRSVERCKSGGHLFDVLASLSEMMEQNRAFPLIWHEEDKTWAKTDDLFQSLSFVTKQKAE